MSRKSLEETVLEAFATGYLQAMMSARGEDVRGVDDWVVWKEYDINFVGTDYAGADMSDTSVLAVVYPRDWVDSLPPHKFSFVVSCDPVCNV